MTMNARPAMPSHRRALQDALRDMMHAGTSPRRLLTARHGVSPQALRKLRLSARTPVTADRRQS